MTAGAVNAHTHLYSGLAPLGLPAPAEAPTTFVQILERVWWKLDRALDERSLRASARLYLAEALLSGTTTLVDHHESPAFIEGSLDVLAEEAEALGARLFVTYGATERNGGYEEARRGLEECARFVREARFPHVKGLVGLHASFTVSDRAVREAGELARELGVPVHVHVAEAESDVLDAKARGYDGPLDRLMKLGALPRGSVVAHGVWLDEASVRRAEAEGLWLVQNPRSNANNRVGYPSALHASHRVALGTDGFPADMDVERDALGVEAKKHGDPAGQDALQARLESGAALVRELSHDASDEVTRARGRPPSEVKVGGRVVVRAGVLQTGDLESIRAHAKEEALRLWSRMRELA